MHFRMSGDEKNISNQFLKFFKNKFVRPLIFRSIYKRERDVDFEKKNSNGIMR